MPEDPAHVPCESEQQLSTKTAKATEIVLGKTPEVIQLDKLRANLARNPKSRYCLNRYENHLTKIQVFVLKAVQQLNADLKAWDTFFLWRMSGFQIQVIIQDQRNQEASYIKGKSH